MKCKILLSALALIFSVSLCACTGCKSEPPKEEAVAVGGIVLENTISTDREFMFAHYATNYAWYESQIVLQEAVNAETCDGTIASVVNVFKFTDAEEQPQIILSTYEVGKPHGTSAPIPDFWVGDSPINDDPINLTFRQAFERLRQANTTLPDSRCCVLRKPVLPGDLGLRPHYIFGNRKRWVIVDAVTGDVTSGSDPG